MRPPIALLHALPLNSAMWAAQTRALADQGFPVIAPDQRGFGAVPLGGAPPSLETVADDLARELDARGAGRVVLAGCSMGGYVAMEFLRRHRSRVLALALLGVRARADTARAAAERETFASAMLDDAVRDQVILRTTPLLLGASTRDRDPDTVARITATAMAAKPESIAWAQRAIAARPDSIDVLRATDLPAVVVAGEEDELVSAEESRDTARALPRGRLVTVPGAGHLLPVEAPERVTGLLVTLAEESVRVAESGGRPC